MKKSINEGQEKKAMGKILTDEEVRREIEELKKEGVI